MTTEHLAESAAFLAGREAARELREAGAGPADGPKYLPHGLHPLDETAWLRGWSSYWS